MVSLSPHKHVSSVRVGPLSVVQSWGLRTSAPCTRGEIRETGRCGHQEEPSQQLGLCIMHKLILLLGRDHVCEPFKESQGLVIVVLNHWVALATNFPKIKSD